MLSPKNHQHRSWHSFMDLQMNLQFDKQIQEQATQNWT